jgi:hypothetical protein
MYNITLICSRHDELGKWNSNELYQILEKVNPDIIFEEIPSSRYYISTKKCLLQNNRGFLEILSKRSKSSKKKFDICSGGAS